MFRLLLSTLLLRPPGGGKGPGARGGKQRSSSGGRTPSGRRKRDIGTGKVAASITKQQYSTNPSARADYWRDIFVARTNKQAARASNRTATPSRKQIQRATKANRKALASLR